MIKIFQTSKRITIIFSLAFMIFLLGAGLVSASPTYKQGDIIQITAVCNNCTYVNLTKVTSPDGTIKLLGQFPMTKNGTNYNYTYVDTNTLGIYTYVTCGDLDGTLTCEDTDDRAFNITPSGFAGTLGFYILILILSAGVIILGFSKNDPTLVILGSFGLYFVGLYVLFNGIDGMKDPIYTWGMGIIVLMIAAYISVRSAYELIVD